MTELGQRLQLKTEWITEHWIEAVAHDQKIGSTDHLSRAGIRDDIPLVLQALATVLSANERNDIDLLVKASFQHGALRTEQGFDPAELAREYHLLRVQIVAALREELIQEPGTAVLRCLELVNAVVDEAIAQCFESYVSQRLQELKNLQQQLSQTNEELGRLVRLSQDNFSQLAHELKTPLNSIIGYSQLFLMQQQSREKTRDTLPTLEHIERVLRNGRKLLHLINDALDLSRYEAGQMQLQTAVTDVSTLVDSVLEMIQPLADGKGLELRRQCEHALSQVVTDPLRLQQILTNLLSNAVNYTETGSITLTYKQVSEQEWAITVADTGVGISPEHQTRIFDPYFRVSSNTQGFVPGGTGLGLAIVARLVKLLQGRLTLTSEVGVGSVFTVTLPLEVGVLANEIALKNRKEE